VARTGLIVIRRGSSSVNARESGDVTMPLQMFIARFALISFASNAPGSTSRIATPRLHVARQLASDLCTSR
jgi:hypothetical protein